MSAVPNPPLNSPLPQYANKAQWLATIQNTISILLQVQQNFFLAQAKGVAALEAFYAQLQQQAVAPKPTYSIDGENVDWVGWQNALQEQIDRSLETRRKLSMPWIVRGRGRAAQS